MQFNLKSLKNIKSLQPKVRFAIVVVVCLISFLGAFFYFSRGKDSVQTVRPLPEQPRAVPQQTMQTAATDAKGNSEKTPDVIKLTEENPFKSEFLKRYEKKTSISGGGPALPPTDVITTVQNMRQLPPMAAVPEISIDKQHTSEEKKDVPLPDIKVFGVYRIRDRIVAITDKGDLQKGNHVNGYEITEISMTGKIEMEKRDRNENTGN